MNELEVFVSIRPSSDPVDQAWRADLRASLIARAAFATDHADIGPAYTATELATFGSQPVGARRTRHWAVAIGLVATLLIVIGLTVTSLGGGNAITTQNPATSSPEASASTTAPPTESTTLATTPPTTPAATVGDPWLPPGVTVPASIVILDPGPPGDIPIRDNPITRWLQYGTDPPEPQRWFVQRDTAGSVTGGVSVRVQPIAESSIAAGEPAHIAGIDATVLTALVPTIHVIVWIVGDEMFSAGSLGDIDLTQLTTVVSQFASAATLDDLQTPRGFTELAVPTERSVITYAATASANPNATLIISRVDQRADLQALTSMIPGRSGPVTPNAQGGYQTTMFEGSQVLVFSTGPDTIAQVIVPAGVDPLTIASGVRTVATETVAVRPTFAIVNGHNPVPATAQPQFGELGGRRFVGYSYTNEVGEHCVYVEVSAGGAPTRCTTSQTPPCSWVVRPTDHAFVAVIPYRADTVEISLDGQPAPSTVQQHDGFTLAYGTAPSTSTTITISANGTPVCTQ